MRHQRGGVLFTRCLCSSMRTTKERLRQYEQALKEEAESRTASYKHDMRIYGERITSYREVFRSHEDYHCQSPMAQNLLVLMADKQEIDSRIKAWDDEIARKQKELARLSEEAWRDERRREEQDQEGVSGDQEQRCAAEEATEQQEMEEGADLEEEEAPSKEDEGLAAFPQPLSQETKPHSPPAAVNSGPSTPGFQFSFSPNSSPQQGTSDGKRPAFAFSLNSGPSTPGFSGFDLGSSQDEDSSFNFTGSFFNEKKNNESKSSGCPEFLFSQQEQSDDFQFAFSATSPQTTYKDNTGDEFPFSINF
ncbi:uncharacterized protein [Brachionichthys hirsutus]|uniref:uncharacterized protein n=1 Tax=Brachionichthys hirsutus TaxID=412623 RepID=UPI00360479C0